MTRRDLLGDLLIGAAAVSLTALSPRVVFAQAASLQAANLICKPIPSSGEMIPVIGLGTARRYEEIRFDAELPPLRDTLQKFKEFGATVIDISPTYGTAEDVVGRILDEQKARPGLFLATKVSISGREAGVAQIEASFKRLRTDRIDLIAVHNLRDTETHLATLRALKQAGRIRYVGCTTSFDNQYTAFEAMMRRETLDFIQVDYALDNRNAAERIIPLAKDRGMAVMINLPFGRSRLFAAVQGKALPEWAAEFDCKSWAQFFLKYLVAHEAVTCAVPGMARAEYVIDNIGAAQGRLPDGALRKRMETFIDGR
ncbi:MAG: aldo/keto reductase [Alphaproteobacteria bacterium]|nr:aldo/keto reductase [Alphaproteobacteria bacterium]